MNLGVVVIGRNEGERLVRCLHSIRAAGIREFVYVDSGSSDASVARARELGAQVVELDLATVEPSLSGPRRPQDRVPLKSAKASFGTSLAAMLAERLGTGRFTESGFEARAVRLVRRAGLPEPVLQHTVRDGDFVAHLDLAWPDVRWGVECDSLAHHSGKRAHEWDRLRRRRLKRLGWDVVEVTFDQVARDAAATGRDLRELYEAHRRTLSSLTADIRGERRQTA